MKKVLLDENLPRQLVPLFSTNIQVTSVPDLGWQSKTNGELLSAMQKRGLEILLTADRNLRFQQNLKLFNVKVAIVFVHDTRLKHLIGMVHRIESALIDWNDNHEVLEIDLRN